MGGGLLDFRVYLSPLLGEGVRSRIERCQEMSREGERGESERERGERRERRGERLRQMGCKIRLQKICKIFTSGLGFKSGIIRGFQKGITLGGRTSANFHLMGLQKNLQNFCI